MGLLGGASSGPPWSDLLAILAWMTRRVSSRFTSRAYLGAVVAAFRVHLGAGVGWGGPPSGDLRGL
eukprot:9488702-Pyramimonas_sp.AAC.2